MAFPVVESTAATSFGGGATSHDLTMPSGVVSGNLLIAAVGNDLAPTRTWPSGWTQLAEHTHGTGAMSIEVRYRISDGTEGSVLTITLDVAEQCFGLIWRISGFDSGQAPIISTSAEAVSAAPDSNSLTATWGSAENLWLSLYTSDPNTGTDFSGTGPTNYTAFSSGGTDDHAAGAHRQLEAETENPGAFTMNGSNDWVAYTLAIKPAAAATGWGALLGGQRSRLVLG